MAGESQPQYQAEAAGSGQAPTADLSQPPAERDAEESRQHACFSSLDVTRVRRALAKLHEQVSFGRGRVEIKRRGCDDVCVMISKAELEALESALEIMAASSEYKAMCDTLAEVAAAAGGYVPAQA